MRDVIKWEKRCAYKQTFHEKCPVSEEKRPVMNGKRLEHQT